MDRYIPLGTHFTDSPALHIDSQAPLHDLQQCAHQRIRAATNLLESLTSVTFPHHDDRDQMHFANAAYLLLRDGTDLLAVIEQRMFAAAG